MNILRPQDGCGGPLSHHASASTVIASSNIMFCRYEQQLLPRSAEYTLDLGLVDQVAQVFGVRNLSNLEDQMVVMGVKVVMLLSERSPISIP